MTDSDLLSPIDAFVQLGRIKLGENSLEAVLERIADLARRSVPGAAEVSITLVPGKGPHTVASTGEMALSLDESQYERGHGPCLDAARTAETFSLPDMSREDRWPDLARRALDAGCHSSLSVGLPVHDDGTAGALNVYGLRTHAFDAEAVDVAQTFGGYAAVALANAHTFDIATSLAENLRRAMEHRAVIEQAKGIIMGDRRCGPDEAFRLLSKLSQDSNRKLRDVATALVERARRP